MTTDARAEQMEEVSIQPMVSRGGIHFAEANHQYLPHLPTDFAHLFFLNDRKELFYLI